MTSDAMVADESKGRLCERFPDAVASLMEGMEI